MNSNKIGKNILLISTPVFVISLFAMFFVERLQEFIGALLLLISYVFFCVSFSLIFYNSVTLKRNKVIKVISIISGTVFIIGWCFKFLHWPGASILVITSNFLFSFGCLPLIMKSRYEKRISLVTEKTLILSIADMISISFILNGLLFKFMHWPGGIHLIISGSVILVITFISWNISFRKEVKLRLVAEEKLKETLNIIEEKQKEITDSINYAKRIQDAILPSIEFVNSYLPHCVINYQPKDIVAGDFYWAEKLGNHFFIAAADCTGHGVPGALVSVVCCNALNRTVNEFKIDEPGEILDKTRELVLETFSKNGSDIKDGMDISLISINGTTVKWAGANNPLWYFHNNEFKIIKANKQPIGKSDNVEPFVTHTLELHKGDLLYLFTDGLADQFGGPKGKKFKYNQIESILNSNIALSVDKQVETLKSAINLWMGEIEQVDDICFIAIKL